MKWRKYPALPFYWFRKGEHFVRRQIARIRQKDDYFSRLRKEAECWRDGNHGNTWMDSRVINELLTETISGDKSEYWLLYFKRKYVRECLDWALNLGCGTGDLEKNAFSIGMVRHFDSLDLSWSAMKKSGLLELRGVRCWVGDINTFEFEEEKYDVVFAVNILHHIMVLERVLDGVRKALKPNGFLVLHEYTGPDRFQWSEEQLREVNIILDRLPKKYKINRRKKGMKKRIYRPLLDETNPNSPFEAVNSSKILPLVNSMFKRVEEVDLGGALLHPLLEAIVENFDDDNPDDARLLQSLWEKERELMMRGVLRSDFTFGVYLRGE